MATATVESVAVKKPFLLKNEGEDLASKTVYLRIRFGMLGNSRKVSNSQVEVDADKKLIKVTKTLLDSPELKAISERDQAIRLEVFNLCLPFDRAVYLVPLGMVETVYQKLKDYEAEREGLVKSFLKAYPELCKKAERELRGVYNPMDYPSIQYVASRFTFQFSFKTFGVPGQLKDISPAIFKEEREKSKRELREAREVVESALLESFAEKVKRLGESLSDTPDGRRRKLHESTLTKLNDFLTTFDLRNVTNYDDLKGQVESVKKLVKGLSVEELRTTESVRDRISKGMDTVYQKLESLATDRPTRKFRFED